MAWQKYDSTYKPGQKHPFKLSRSKIDLFLECPRCFWLDRRLGIKRPDMPPFQINKAVDELLKNEFDDYRLREKPHPYMKEAGFDGIPYKNENLNQWRDNFTGIQYQHKDTNLLVFGAVDDIWIDTKNVLAIVDYKATSKNKVITDLDSPGGWHDSYRRQIEVYQWLFRNNGFDVSDTGYFVYANGRSSGMFNNKVEFVTHTFPYTGTTDWIEPVLLRIKECLEGTIPDVGNGPLGQGCTHCAYARQRTQITLDALRARSKN